MGAGLATAWAGCSCCQASDVYAIGTRHRAKEKDMEPTQLLSRLPSRLHHHAYVVRDHEANRRFFEDLLGIPLVATWCEKSFSSDLGKEIDFCHTFFGMADGSALAFLQFADPEMYELTQAEQPAKIGRYDHIAFKAEPETYDELKRRLERAREPSRESNHGLLQVAPRLLPRRAGRRIHRRRA